MAFSFERLWIWSFVLISRAHETRRATPDQTKVSTTPWYRSAGERVKTEPTRGRGTCTNKLTIPRPEVEQPVLRALQDKSMRKDFFEEFCREFAKEMNRLRMEQRAGLTGAKRELERVKRDIQRVIEAIKAGFALPELKVEMEALQVRKEAFAREARCRGGATATAAPAHGRPLADFN
jgi:hypothetical protein